MKMACAAGIRGDAVAAVRGPTQVIEVWLDGPAESDRERGVVAVEIDHPSLKAVEVPVVILK